MMQDQPLVNKITSLLSEIKSNEIMQLLSQPNLNKIDLLTLIIESKIGYDKWHADDECANIIDEIEEHHIYDDENYNKLLNYISNLGSPSENAEADLKLLLWFRHFHTMILKTCNVVVKLMNNHRSVPVPKSSMIGNSSPESKIMSKEVPRSVANVQEEHIHTNNADVTDSNINPDDEDLNLNSFLKSISLV